MAARRTSRTVGLTDARERLSQLIDEVATGKRTEIVISRRGRAAAKLVGIRPANLGRRIGVAKGRFIPPEPNPRLDARIAALFGH